MRDAYTSYRNILRIAYPIMIGSLAQNLIGIIDTAFMGRVGEAQLGAAGLGGIYYFIMVLVGFGFNTGMQITIARRAGEKRFKEIGSVFDHEFYIIAIVACLQFLLLHFFSTGILRWMIHSEDVYQNALQFNYFRSFGIFFALFNSLCQSLFIGLGKTRILNFTTPLLALINVILDYCLIFGHAGLPQMGIGGAALASTIAEASVTCFYIIYLFRSGHVREYNLFGFRSFSLHNILKLLDLSAPLVFQQVISISTWFGFFVIIEHLGEMPLAASNIMRSIYIFCGIPNWALGSAVNSMVSNLIGQKREGDVLYVIKKIIVANFSIIVCLCVALLFFSTGIVHLYTNDENLIEQTVHLVPTIVLALLLMSASFICIFAVSGTGSTHISLLIEVIAILLYVIYTYLTAIHFHMSLQIIWGAESVYWTVTLILCGSFLRYGKWVRKV